MEHYHLAELYHLISGKLIPWMSGLTTYPDGDENQQALQRACRELERLGLIQCELEIEGFDEEGDHFIYCEWRTVEGKGE